MHTKTILNKLDKIIRVIEYNMGGSIQYTHIYKKLNKVKKGICILHGNYTNIISKNIKEIDMIQDELYDLRKKILIMNSTINKLNHTIKSQYHVIYIKNKRIFKLLSNRVYKK